MQINNIVHIKRKPNASGFFEAQLKPLSGENIHVEFSKGAIKDMERLVNHNNSLLEKEAAAAPTSAQVEDEV